MLRLFQQILKTICVILHRIWHAHLCLNEYSGATVWNYWMNHQVLWYSYKLSSIYGIKTLTWNYPKGTIQTQIITQTLERKMLRCSSHIGPHQDPQHTANGSDTAVKSHARSGIYHISAMHDSIRLSCQVYRKLLLSWSLSWVLQPLGVSRGGLTQEDGAERGV
jgi:hypothetical protein